MIGLTQWRLTIGRFSGGRGLKVRRASDPYSGSTHLFFEDLCKRLLLCAVILWVTTIVNRILTVLQQPHIIILVQCGDVELNPGPTIELEAQLTDLNKNIEDKSERMHNEMSGLGFEMRKMVTTLELVTESVNSIKEEIRNLRENIKEVEEKQEHLQLDIETNAAGRDQLELKIETLSNSVEKQEQYSRRENLILRGMKEEADESSEKSRLAVVALLNKNVTTKHWREEDFLRAHRPGHTRNSSETPRPLIVRFMHHFDKLKVLRARDKLKETGIGVANDLTLHQRTELAKLRKQGKSAYCKNGTLILQDPSAERNNKITGDASSSPDRDSRRYVQAYRRGQQQQQEQQQQQQQQQEQQQQQQQQNRSGHQQERATHRQPRQPNA
ncbi:hypothetical protein RRG08_033342 [Elysia crispata]|uniref:Uncharacterized protein n=1 Tax=Elysia crispata TaxID=231223 RepID=A0AAE0Z7U8_9GAST|nr:hypothetical protein RRG08_033342 [Elysia crispata]